MRRETADNGVVYYASDLLRAAGVRHAFSTRIGGASDGVFASLNLGNPSGCELQDAGERIEENYQRLQATIGCAAMERCRANQVHGAGVLHLRTGEPFENGRKADAIVSDDPARLAAVRVADCVPVLLATRDGRLVAAVHAGWRGVIAGVVAKAVAEMSDRSRARSRDILAAVGPCIGMDAFEVGGEVIAEFERVFESAAPIRRRDDGKGYVDLRRAVRQQLMNMGLPDESIDVSDRCTFRDADEFYSHRRDNGVTGRMAALIAPRAESIIIAGDAS